MFCPQCGSSQPDDLRFCKQCGANLAAVRTAVVRPETVEKFDWSKTWLAEMFMSSEESLKREAELERLQGITPETKRQNEIKAGVITASVGIGLMILLYVLMQGIILSGNLEPGVDQILSRIWIAGIIPVFVGMALIINGVFVSKRTASSHAEISDKSSSLTSLPTPVASEFLPPADTNQLASAVPFSITDETTKHLKQPIVKNREP